MEFREEPFDARTEFDDALFYVSRLQEQYPIPTMTAEDIEKYKASIPPMRIIKA